MNFYCDSGGVIFHVDPERIFQGSAGVNKIRFVGQFPSNAQVLVSYKLPNGIWTVPKYMTFVSALEEVQAPNGGIFSVWESLLGATPKVDSNGAPVLVDGVQQYELDYTITQNAGTVDVQFFVYAPAEQSNVQNGTRLATEISSITVEKGVPVVVPEYSETDDYEVLLQQILNALTAYVDAYQDVEQRLTTAENNIGVLQEDTANLRTELDELTEKVDDLDADLTTAEENIATLQNDVNVVENDIVQLKTSVSIVQIKATNLQNEVDDLQNDVSGITTDVQNIREALDLAEITETVEVTDKYNSRQTANGLTLYPEQPTTLLKVEGDTIATINRLDLSSVNNSILEITENGKKITTNGTGSYVASQIGVLQDLCPTIHIGDVIYLYCKDDLAVLPSGLVDANNNVVIPVNTATTITAEMLATTVHLGIIPFTQGFVIEDLQITKVQNAPWTPYFEGLKSAEFAGVESKNAEETETSTLVFPNTVNPLGQTIDFENKKIVDYGVELVLTGTESWVYSNANLWGSIGPSLYIWDFLPESGSNFQSNAVSTDGYLEVKFNGTLPKGNIVLGSGNRAFWWYACFNYLGLDASWADKDNPTAEEQTTAIANFKAYLAQRYADGNPVIIRYVAPSVQSETPFTEEQTAAGDSYIPYTGGTETVDNANAEWGLENTVTQEYDIVNKIGG